jgi:ZIP family zinc transporter
MIIGFVLGAIVFSILNHYLKRLTTEQSNFDKENDKDDNNNNHRTPQENVERKEEHYNDSQLTADGTTGGSAKIVFAGLLLDSIPEALFVGILIALGHGGIVGAVAALFLGNLTTTMEGAKRMSLSGMSVSRIMLRWSFVLAVVAMSAPLGFYLVKPLTSNEVSIILGVTAGILIAFITEDLIPEAYRKANFHIGLSTTFGFLLGYILFHFL